MRQKPVCVFKRTSGLWIQALILYKNPGMIEAEIRQYWAIGDIYLHSVTAGSFHYESTDVQQNSLFVFWCIGASGLLLYPQLLDRYCMIITGGTLAVVHRNRNQEIRAMSGDVHIIRCILFLYSHSNATIFHISLTKCMNATFSVQRICSNAPSQQ